MSTKALGKSGARHCGQVRRGLLVPLPKLERIVFKEVAAGPQASAGGWEKAAQTQHTFRLLCSPHPQPKPGRWPETGNACYQAWLGKIERGWRGGGGLSASLQPCDLSGSSWLTEASPRVVMLFILSRALNRGADDPHTLQHESESILGGQASSPLSVPSHPSKPSATPSSSHQRETLDRLPCLRFSNQKSDMKSPCSGIYL